MEESKTWQEKLTKAGIITLICLALIMGYLGYHAGRFDGLNNIQALDYAQVARNLAEGKGYTTNLIRPLSLARFPRFEGHPELIAPPLHPYMGSLFMRVMADKEKALALSGGLAFLMTVPLVFFLGWQLFDLRSGLLAAGLYGINVGNLRASISGLETPWLALWVALLLLVCYNLSRKQRWRVVLAAIAGIVMGLIYLTSYMWLVVVPVLAIYILLASDRRTRWGATGLFLILFVLTILPWCIRTAHVTGSPFFSLEGAQAISGTRTNPGNTLLRQFVPETEPWVAYAATRPMEIIQKAADGMDTLYPTLLNMGGPYVTPFFLVAILVALGSGSFERTRGLAYAMFVVLFVVSLFISPVPRLLVPLGVLVTAVAAGFFFRLLETRVGARTPLQRQRMLTFGVGLLCLIQGLPTVFDLFAPQTPGDLRTQEYNRAAKEVAAITDGPVITDVPWLIAWNANRPAVWLPKTAADLLNMEKKVGKVAWLMLTPQVADRNYDTTERAFKEWGAAWYEGVNGDVDFQGYTAVRRVGTGPWVVYRANPAAKQTLPPDAQAPFDEPAAGGTKSGR